MIRDGTFFVSIKLSSVQTTFGVSDEEISLSIIPFVNNIVNNTTEQYQDFKISFTALDYLAYNMYTNPNNNKIETNTNNTLRSLWTDANLKRVSLSIVTELINLLVLQEYGNHKFALFGSVVFDELPTYYRSAIYFDDINTIWIISKGSGRNIIVKVKTSNKSYTPEFVDNRLSQLFKNRKLPSNLTRSVEQVPKLKYPIYLIITALGHLNPITRFIRKEFSQFESFLKIFLFVSLYEGTFDISRFTNILQFGSGWIGWSFISLKRYTLNEPVSSAIFSRLIPSGKTPIEDLAVRAFRD